jgi:uncharacterized protein YbaR (Trm112 family)
MKDEITIPVLKVEDLIRAADRREEYSRRRDLQAQDFNEAIFIRQANDTDKQESVQSEIGKVVSCKKCEKDFTISMPVKEETIYCPDCKAIYRIK